MGENEAMIDYILVNNKYISSVKYVKVIPDEELVSQHCLLLMDMALKKKVGMKVKFRKKLKLWRLRESEMKEEFAEVVNNRCDGLTVSSHHVTYVFQSESTLYSCLNVKELLA